MPDDFPDPEQWRLHCVDLARGRFRLTSADDIERSFQSCSSKTLVVHFHGGLNSHDDGRRRVAKMTQVYRNAGAWPFFFAWGSGLTEVVCSALERCRDRQSQVIREAIRSTVLTKLARTPVAAASMNSAHVRGRPHETVHVENFVAQLSPAERMRTFTLTPEDEEHFEAQLHRVRTRGLELHLTRHALDMLRRICRRLAEERDHGLQATITEEILLKLDLIGGWFSSMKQEIEDAFGDAPECGGSAFLRVLSHKYRTGDITRIVLVGHSAGSIYVCRMLEESAKLLPEAKFDVALLTPACSFERFDRMLDANGGAIGHFLNLNLTDELECADGYGILYPRSLLYFTSGVMELDSPDVGDVPILGMQRYYSGCAPYDAPLLHRVRSFLSGRDRHCVFVNGSCEISGYSGNTGHGDFDLYAGTRRILASFIQNGAIAPH